MAFDYEAAKAEFGVERARALENEARAATAATDAPQASSQPQAESSKKAGVGGGGWNEDFDEAWGRRVLENPKLKDLFGLSDYSSLRDAETRRQINRWLRDNKGAEQAAGGAAAPAAAAASTATTGAAKKAEATQQPAGTTGKTSMPGGVSGPPAAPPRAATSVFASGRLPTSQMWGDTVLPAAGGTIPAQDNRWWPSYPAGGAPPATKPGTASMQASALAEQRS